MKMSLVLAIFLSVQTITAFADSDGPGNVTKTNIECQSNNFRVSISLGSEKEVNGLSFIYVYGPFRQDPLQVGITGFSSNGNFENYSEIKPDLKYSSGSFEVTALKIAKSNDKPIVTMKIDNQAYEFRSCSEL